MQVWISPDVADQFRFVSDVSGELRAQIREMRELGKTPEDFGLMVRKHPETLAITAKKGVSESRSMVISLSGRRIETTKIPANHTVLSDNRNAVRDFLVAIEADSGDKNWNWKEEGLQYPGKLGVSKDRIADLLESFRYDRGNLILANSLHKLIRDQTSSAFQDWTVGIVGGTGRQTDLAPGLTMQNTPKRAVRYSTDGSVGSFRVSGSSARLAGSTDLAKTYAHSGDDLVEPAVYRELPHPTLLIYPLDPNWEVASIADTERATQAADEETDKAEKAWEASARGEVEVLMALKIAIPGEPGAKSGDVVLPAQWARHRGVPPRLRSQRGGRGGPG